MKNPITRNTLFITPRNFEELVHIAEGMDNVAQAYQMVAFTLNLCHRMVEDELDRDEARQEELIAMRLAVAPRRTTDEA